MTTVATRHHFIYSSSNEMPLYACKGKCKSVWWEYDIPRISVLSALNCPKCNGQLKLAESTDYQLIDTPENMQQHIDKHGAKINTFSVVKPEFEELAKKGWF